MISTVLVAGAAGFIGAALALRLLERAHRVLGIDNLNCYNDLVLKRARLQCIETAVQTGAWRFESMPLEDAQGFADWYRNFYEV